jgi:NAD(P)-dependent dehydrogenase (short-subunit alcohol dehydrogenase family)
MTVTIAGSRVLVTGAGRGLGRAFVEALVERGANAVYGGARNPATVTTPGVIPIRLDITDPVQVDVAALRCNDVDIVINSGGVMRGAALMAAADLSDARMEMETNYFGTLSMCRAFAPVLAANGGGALVNVLSVVAWVAVAFNGSYCASKSAGWALTNAARLELRSQGTHVIGIYASFIDTDMAANVDLAKISARQVAEQTIEGIEAGAEEILVDKRTRDVRAALSGDLHRLYPVQATDPAVAFHSPANPQGAHS